MFIINDALVCPLVPLLSLPPCPPTVAHPLQSPHPPGLGHVTRQPPLPSSSSASSLSTSSFLPYGRHTPGLSSPLLLLLLPASDNPLASFNGSVLRTSEPQGKAAHLKLQRDHYLVLFQHPAAGNSSFGKMMMVMRERPACSCTSWDGKERKTKMCYVLLFKDWRINGRLIASS